MSHPYKKEAEAGMARKLKAYGGQSGNAPLTHAGFPALNTDTQAGRAPLNSKDYIPPEVTARTARKKGGAVKGAASLKRLDKAPRGKVPTGTRKGPIPGGTDEQIEFDPTLKIEPGEMSEASPRKKGGRVQDYTDRSHESQGAQGLRKRQAHAAGGKAMHDDEKEDRALVKKMVKGDALTGKSCGGRAKRADGGALGAFSDYGAGSSGGKSSGGSRKPNGRTTVNIMIGAPKAEAGPDGMPMPMPMGPGAGAPPPMAPPMAPPPAAAAGPMPGGPPPGPVGGAPQMPPGGMPMPRKDGGSVQVKYRKPGRKDGYPAMDFGSGGGFGRKQKIDSYGTKGPSNKDNY